MLNYRQLNYIFTFRYLYLTFLFIFSINIHAIHGYVSFEHSATDKDWSFLPKITNSFDYIDFSSLEIMLVHNKYVLKTNSSKFYLNLERPIEPKSLNLNAKSDLLESFLKETEIKNYENISTIEKNLFRFNVHHSFLHLKEPILVVY